MLLLSLVDQKRLHHLQFLWTPDWNESPGITLSGSASLRPGYQSWGTSGNAKCRWLTPLPDSQDPGLHQYINIYNVLKYTSISLHKLNKTFEQDSRAQHSGKNTILWSKTIGSLRWLAVWSWANHFNPSGPQFSQKLNVNSFPCHLHKIALYGINKDTIQV